MKQQNSNHPEMQGQPPIMTTASLTPRDAPTRRTRHRGKTGSSNDTDDCTGGNTLPRERWSRQPSPHASLVERCPPESQVEIESEGGGRVLFGEDEE
mmetsp:Transcript_33125/g.95937  ORF Transcript_33125/g.95937 Transcript_33125/m.95937 type:complete len:97 (+) Transcript_33125:1015-1305(+)